jgi:hypothetical protein
VDDIRRAQGPRFAVRFDEDALADDLSHATAAGRQIAAEARELLGRHGVPASLLTACEPEARDGTHLAGCVKLYLPDADGAWGMVFRAAFALAGAGTPTLLCLAFGVRHPAHAWQPSVYQVAHRRLHGRHD